SSATRFPSLAEMRTRSGSRSTSSKPNPSTALLSLSRAISRQRVPGFNAGWPARPANRRQAASPELRNRSQDEGSKPSPASLVSLGLARLPELERITTVLPAFFRRDNASTAPGYGFLPS